MHVLKFNDRRIRDIWKVLCHRLHVGGKGNTFSTGQFDVSMILIVFTVKCL